jgi:hypothetical protein
LLISSPPSSTPSTTITILKQSNTNTSDISKVSQDGKDEMVTFHSHPTHTWYHNVNAVLSSLYYNLALSILLCLEHFSCLGCEACCLLHACFLLGLFFNPAYGGSMLLWNTGWLVLYAGRWCMHLVSAECTNPPHHHCLHMTEVAGSSATPHCIPPLKTSASGWPINL